MGLLWVRDSIKLLSYDSVVLTQSQYLCETIGALAYLSTIAFTKLPFFSLSGCYRFVDLNLPHCQSRLSAYGDMHIDRWHDAFQINKSFSCCHLMSPCNPDLDSLEWKVWTSCKCYWQDVPTRCLLMLLGWKSAFSLRNSLESLFWQHLFVCNHLFLHLKCTHRHCLSIQSWALV